MFKAFKEKLKGFFKKKEEIAKKPLTKDERKAKEEAEKKAKLREESKEIVEKTIKEIEKKPEIEEEIKEDVDEEIELPQKFDVAKHKFEPDLDKIKGITEESEEKQEKKSLFKRLKEKVTTATISDSEFNEMFEELELIMLENNVAVEVVEEIQSSLKDKIVNQPISKKNIDEAIKTALREVIEDILIEPFDLTKKIKEKEGTFKIVFFGINGSGKTTTIAKIANLLKKNNISSVLAASDTFRAASIEQLSKHAEKLKIKLIKQHYEADPAAVAYDAIEHAKAHKIKVVLIDTAGRMHTKENLLREMGKICRVTKPDLKVFVAESITGNDAVEQAKHFSESVGIDAIILTKSDVDEKGGTAISIGKITGKPILFLGTGQNYEDLESFNKNKILEQLGL